MFHFQAQAYLEHQPGDPTDVERSAPPDPDPIDTDPALLAPGLDQLSEREQERVGGLLNPRSPGFSGTERDWAKMYEVIHEQTRRHYSDWTAQAVTAKAVQRYEAMHEVKHPQLAEQLVQLMPDKPTPSRAGVRSELEVRAIRQLPAWRELEALLTAPAFGRPTDRLMPMACLNQMVLQDGAPQIRQSVLGFTGSNLSHDWAFLDSYDVRSNGTLMREESSVRKQIKKMLKRNDAEVILSRNAQLLQQLQPRLPGLGDDLVVDGTPIPAWVDQTTPVSSEHQELVVRDTGAEFNRHGEQRDLDGNVTRQGKTWLGNVLLTICCMRYGIALIWVLLPKGPEYPFVMGMLRELRRLMPFLHPQTITGDREYDRSGRLAMELHVLMDIVPIFPLRNQLAARFEHRLTAGVPECGRRGHGLMTFKQHDRKGWTPQVDAMPGELTTEQLERHFRGSKIRWYCAECAQAGRKTQVQTYGYKNPRLYTWLPRAGSDWRVASRMAHMLQRNVIESVFSQLKRRGIGAAGHQNCRWATERQHLEWLIGLGFLGLNARRLVHLTGLYNQAVDEAWEHNLLKVRPPYSVQPHEIMPLAA